MKQKDLALVLVLAFIGAIVSFFVSNVLFASPKNRQQQAEKVDVITANFPSPPPRYFSSNSINPTLPVQIGNNNNPNPFNTKSQ
ncbi:MAG TPA: hypothetical protein VLI54_02140 [Bacillota bacterium]|nr:hypothetical protein [Bacillota bacterium]